VNRATSTYFTRATALIALGVVLGITGPAMAAGAATARTSGAKSTMSGQCKGESVKPVVHADAVRREGTLSSLVAKLQARKDPYGVNGAQIAALQSAGSAITALDGQIASTCYPTVAALHADASKIFVDYRVYWLRVPQSEVIDASDHMAEASGRLGDAATKLASLVGSNATAQADLAAMNSALGAANAKLGTPPAAGPTLAPVPGLTPAADMTHDTAVLEAAYTDVLSIRASLVAARADGLKVLTDLQH
jgi:hypothetical protein